MNELWLIGGGLAAAFLLLRSFSTVKKADSTPRPPPIAQAAKPPFAVKSRESDWTDYLESLPDASDPELVQQELAQLSLEQLVDLHQWLGLKFPPEDSYPDLYVTIRSLLVLDVYLELQEKTWKS